MTKDEEIKAMLKRLLNQGADLTKFRKGLAERFGVTVEEMDGYIAQAGPSRVVDAETVAQERLAEERAFRRSNPAEWRRHNHEEE